MSKYYAVKVGRKTGIFSNWDETKSYVSGYSGAKYKSFKNLSDAQSFIGLGTNKINVDGIESIKETVGYTDGSCVDKVGGYGAVILRNNQEEKINGKVPYYPTTNQVSELYAIYVVLSKIETDITIMTDSKYSIGCLTQWFPTWIKNGWVNSKGEPVKNQELIKSILKLMAGRKVEFVHVKAHAGIKYNEMADKLANSGRLK